MLYLYKGNKMKLFILKILAKLEDKRNEFLWDMFNYFFYQDYEYIDLDDRFYKYTNKLKDIREETPEEKKERLRILGLRQKLEFDRKPVELYEYEDIARDFLVLNLDTEKYMDRVIYANQTTGMYIHYKQLTKNGKFRRLESKCNLVLVWKADNEKR